MIDKQAPAEPCGTEGLFDTPSLGQQDETFSIQGDLLKDSVQELLSASSRISQLSAQVAHEAVEKLNARSQSAADNRR